MRRRVVLFLCAVVIAAVVSLSACVSTDLSGQAYPSGYEAMLADAPAARAEGTQLRVMSFNMLVHIAGWGGTPVPPRAKMFLGMLDTYLPDIIGAQEVCSDWHRILADNLPAQYRALHAKINAFSYNKTPLIYNADTLELLESGYEPYSVGDNNGCRAVTWGVFRIRATGQKIVVTSTHLDLIRPGKVEQERTIMMQQTAELLALTEQLEQTYSCPVLACGDYNSMERADALDSEGNPLGEYAAADVYAVLAQGMQDIKYTDGLAVHSYVEDAFEPTWDHIFVRGNVIPHAFYVLSHELYKQMSDHFPIVADVSIGGSV